MITQGRVRIRMHVDPITIGNGLDDLQAQFTEGVGAIWSQAQREPVLDGRAASVKTGKVTFSWRGPHAAEIDNAGRRRVEDRLSKAILGFAKLPAPKIEDKDVSTWLGEAIDFSAPLVSLLAIMNEARGIASSYILTLQNRYQDYLDQPVSGVVWVVEATLPTPWTTLYDGVMTRIGQRFTRGSPFFYIWDATRHDQVVALDPGSLAGRVPRLNAPASQPDPRYDFTIAAGTRIAFVAFALPTLTLDDMVRVGETIELQLPIASLLRDESESEGIDRGWFSREHLARGMRVKPERLLGLRETYADRTITVRIVPLTPRRDVSVVSLNQFVLEFADQGDRFSDELGRLMLLGHRNVEAMPEEIAGPLRRLAGDVRLSTQDVRRDDGHWPTNSIGAFVYPCVDKMILELVDAIPSKALVEQQWLPELVKILQIEDLDVRSESLGRYIDAMELGPVAFETLLIGLDHSKLLQFFFDATRLATRWYWGTRGERGAKIAVRALRSRYATEPALLALIESLRFKQFEETWLTGPMATFDPRQQLIVLPGSGNKVYARGNYTDNKRGVLAEASDDFYSEKSKVRQLRPELLDSLGDPLRAKVGKIVSRMACQSGETRTEKQLIAEATKLVMEDMRGTLKPEDFVEVSMRRSLRVLALEEPVISGVPQLRVRIEPVYKIGDGPWEVGGPVELITPGEFQMNRLTYYQVNHMVHFLTVFVMLETALATGVFIVVTGIVGLAELLLWVAISELTVIIKKGSDLKFEDLVEAALMGELQAVGFKGLSAALGTPLKLLGGRAVSALGIGEVGTKWIATGLKAGITSVEFGALGMVELFANDLMRMTRCREMSSPSEYAERFTTGFKFGVLMEFGGPALKPILAKVPGLGALVRRASTSLELGAALRSHDVAFEDIASVLVSGRRQLRESLMNVLDNPEVTDTLLRNFEQSANEMLESLGKQLVRAYKREAYGATLELLGVKMDADASRGLERLLAKRKIDEIDAVLRAVDARGESPQALLRALGAIDEASADALATPGRLIDLARSPRTMEALEINDKASILWLIEGPFKGSIKNFETFLDKLTILPAKESKRVLGALFEHDPLPPDLLLKAAQEGPLDAAAFRRLREQAKPNQPRLEQPHDTKPPPVDQPHEPPPYAPADASQGELDMSTDAADPAATPGQVLPSTKPAKPAQLALPPGHVPKLLPPPRIHTLPEILPDPAQPFVVPDIEAAYQRYLKTKKPPELPAPRDRWVGLTRGEPREELKKWLGTQFPSLEGGRTYLELSTIPRPSTLTQGRLQSLWSSVMSDPAKLSMKYNPSTAVGESLDHFEFGSFNSLKGQVGELIGRPVREQILQDIQKEFPLTRIYDNVRATPADYPGETWEFTDGIAAERVGNDLVVRGVFETKAGAGGGYTGTTQTFKWNEKYLEEGSVIRIEPANGTGPVEEFIYDPAGKFQRPDGSLPPRVRFLQSAPRHIMVPPGSETLGVDSAEQIAGALSRHQLPATADEIVYITGLAAQALVGGQVAGVPAAVVSPAAAP